MDRGNILLRRYLCKRLSEYYSQPAEKVVGSVGIGFDASDSSSHSRKGIQFSSLINEWHWKYTHRRLYDQQRGMWLTPVELFYPHYSNILANFVNKSKTTSSLTSMSRDNPGELFEVVELGGGRGTNALTLLNYLADCYPKTYDSLQCYTIFDTSKTLHEHQRDVLMRSRHAEKVKLVNIDMIDVAEGNAMFLTPSDTPTAVIALELLDNLPHDKIGRCIETGDILQAMVVPCDGEDSYVQSDFGSISTHVDTSIRYSETFAPMSDPLLRSILSIAPSLYTPTIRPRWIPSVALGILMKLYECRPNSSVAFADFDWLPPSDSSMWTAAPNAVATADGDPIVTDMAGNDHECYLTSPPNALCDILFPTDFGRLANFANQFITKTTAANTSGRGQERHTAMIMKQHDFLIKYGPDEVEKTKGWTGYSPMINDFGNCSVLVITLE